MQGRSAEFAIIGAGPAGAHLASRLADDGRDVVLFDPRGAWEKPCGGGVPTRAIREFAFILNSSSYPRKLVRQITMISPLDRRVTLKLDEPFAVYSRQVLNSLVLDQAIEAGADFVREGVTDFSREADGWTVSTDAGNRWRARFLVGADGAASFIRRRLIGIFPKRDLALAFGYNILDKPEHSETPMRADAIHTASNQVVMRFTRGFTGYIWAFPRPGAMNFGIASKLGERTSDELRKTLLDFIRDHYDGSLPELEGSFFGATIPVLDPASWPELRASGEGWALIGDAAGFVDPITGEGIYYALKSAELLATSLRNGVALSRARRDNGVKSTLADETATATKSLTLRSSIDYREACDMYERLWRIEFGLELERASQMLLRFYQGYFAGHVFSDAMIRIARHHTGVRGVLTGLILGTQKYTTLKRDLISKALRIF